MRRVAAGLLCAAGLALPACEPAGEESAAPEPTTAEAPSPTRTAKSNSESLGREGTKIEFGAGSGEAEIGVPYEFSIWTHCGWGYLVDFDGSFWRPVEAAGPTIHDMEDFGTMTLLSPDTARYESISGTVVTYERVEETVLIHGCT